MWYGAVCRDEWFVVVYCDVSCCNVIVSCDVVYCACVRARVCAFADAHARVYMCLCLFSFYGCSVKTRILYFGFGGTGQLL